MIIGAARETAEFETRVALSPLTVKKYIELGFGVAVEKNAGKASGFSDDEYKAAGADIVSDFKTLAAKADILLKVQKPSFEEIKQIKAGTFVMAHMDALTDRPTLEALAKAQTTAFGLELIPRISRAQSMDILSSQSNLAGYKAVIDAIGVYGKAVPMMMTAAGTITPAKVLILGAGVAGLQAIATARRLGAVVYGTDIRPETKEQIESLGARFTDNTAETLKIADIVICTALALGRKAPVLITNEMLKTMKTGAVIADMAVAAGGNCEGSEYAKTVYKDGVTILGNPNLPAMLPADASALLARNYLNFVAAMAQKDKDGKPNGKITLDKNDEIVKSTLLTEGGEIVNPLVLKIAAEKSEKQKEEKTKGKGKENNK